jgi:hypothetical protein
LVSSSENPEPEAAAARPRKVALSERVCGFLFILLQRLFIDGPDPVADDDRRDLLEVLLPWPVRWAAVVAIIWATSMWHDTGVGQQLAWGLQIGGFCLIAIIATFWALVLTVDCGLALLWFIPFAAPTDAPRRWPFLHAITFVNRQIEHIKALLVWTLIALTHSSRLSFQVGLTSAVFLLGPPLVNGLGRLRLPFLGGESGDKHSGDLYWRRRLLIYAATLGGLSDLALGAPGQLAQLSRLVLAFVTGVVLRVARHWWRGRQVKGDERERRHEKLQARRQFRESQARIAHRGDAVGPGLVLLGVAGIVVFSWWSRRDLGAELATPSDGSPAPRNACTADPDRPSTADIALLLMADTQTHELAGAPFPGQTELANVFARTATRPVALDMLSSAPLARFGRIYDALVAKRRQAGLSTPLWGHLGDLTDLACQHEMTRMLRSLEPFNRHGKLAGIAVGNHEVAFEGSFHWSPYWDSTCRSGRLSARSATEMLRSAVAERLPAGSEIVSLPPSLLNPSAAVLASVVPLGVTQHHAVERGVVGIFLDTSDGRALDWGNPGSYGAVSQDQIEAVESAVRTLLQSSSDPYRQRPVYVLFSHVPLGALVSDSRGRVEQLVQWLDAQPSPSRDTRVLALLSAHTHVASSHHHCIGKRYRREIVLGSTVDPPQQAALVDIGPDDRGRLSLSVRTLASVARPELSCGPVEGVVTAGKCRKVAEKLRREPACSALLLPEPHAAPARDCQQLEQGGSLSGRLSAIRTYRGPRDERDRRQLDEVKASTLLQCICHGDDSCGLSETPLRDESYVKILDEHLASPERQEELTCLAWAAGAMQAHKDNDMTMSEAMHCAFDDPTLPAERVSVAKLEASPCY